MKFQFPINNFTAGEWSPKMIARTDADEYKNASQSLQNALVQIQGGAFKRPGFGRVYVGSTYQGYLNGATLKRIFPWVLSDGSRYVVCATNDEPVTGVYPWFIWDEVHQTASTLSCVTNGIYPDVANASLASMQFCQVGDILFFATENGAPMFLRKEGSNFFIRQITEGVTYTQIVASGASTANTTAPYWQGFPYGPLNSSSANGTMTVTGTFTVGGTVNVVSSFAMFALSMATLPMTFMKFTAAGSTGVVALNTYHSNTSIDGTVIAVLPSTSPQAFGAISGTAWEISAWNPVYGWPRTVTAFQGRVIFGGSAKYPDTIWGSEIGNIYNFMEVPFAQDPTFSTFGEDNTRPFTLTPNSKTSSNIRALSSSKVLTINTDRAEIVAYGTQEALGPNDVTFESSTFFGSESVQPVGVNNYLTFVQRGGRKVRDIVYSFQEDQYKSGDLTFLADHVADGDPIAEMVGAEMGSSYIWARTHNGRLLSVTLDRDYHVNAWTRHSLGGSYTGSTPPVLSIAALQASYASRNGFSSDSDSLYVLANVTINGATVCALTKLTRIFDPNDTLLTLTLNGVQIPQYMDFCTYATSGSPTKTYTFADLANETLSVLADGVYVGEFTLNNSGVLTLAANASSVLVGYKYTMTVKPMPIEQGSQIGSAQGLIKRTNDIYVRVWNTGDINYGIPGNLFPVPLSSALVTDDIYLKMPPGNARRYEVEMQSTKPLPCNILAIVFQGMGYD